MPATQSPFESSKEGAHISQEKRLGGRLVSGLEKIGGSLNSFSNRIGSEAWWPTTLDHECEKAARILSSFCKDGCYPERSSAPDSLGPKSKPKVVVKIPQRVFQNCVGLAIFTVMRSGFSISTAGGSGVVIARKEYGDWSPPSGIHVQTLGLGFMVGIDIYDCIVVINSYEALKSFNRFRFTLGGEMSAVAGPIGVGGLLEVELSETHKPLWTYMKSRGVYCGLQLDTTILIERFNENARFYGKKISIDEIFAGQVTNVPLQAKMLMEAARRAEGRV
ncbi:unnamed protein product [Alternaria alternata]